MKRVLMFAVYVLVGMIALGVTAFSSDKKMKKEATAWPAGDIKWVEAKEGPPGIMFAPLWGDMSKGAFGTLVKFTAGLDNPLHTHSYTAKLVVISGSFWYAPEGGEKKMLGPGSYLEVPGGLKHTSGAEAGTVVFQEGSGKWDMKMVEAPKGMKK